MQASAIEVDSKAGVPDAELLAAFVRHADRDALATLLLRHADSAYRLARRMSGNAADAEELVQTAFLNVIQNAAGYRGASSVKGWIMTIVANVTRNRLREQAARQARETAAGREQSASTSEPPADLRPMLLDAVEKLPELYRLPVYLRYLENLSFPEVAATLAIPERTARTHVSRGLEQLRELLGARGQALETTALASLLLALPLEHAPATLAASVKALSATTATSVAGSALAGSSTAAKSLAVWKLAGAVLLATVGVAAVSKIQLTPAAAVVSPRPLVTNGDESPGGGAPEHAKAADPFAAAAPELQAILDKKICAIYRRDRLAYVLLDLKRRAGLKCAAAAPWIYGGGPALPIQNFLFSFEAPDVSVRDVLKALFAAGGITPELHGETIVLWKPEVDATLAALIERAKSPDLTTRRLAVLELGRLSDPRIFPTLFGALTDEIPEISLEAIHALESQKAVLPYVKDIKAAVPAIVQAWRRLRPEQSNPNSGISGIEWSAMNVLAATGDSRAVDALLPEFRDVNTMRSSCAMNALAKFDDPRIVKEALALYQTQDQSNRSATLNILGRSKDEAAQAAYKEALNSGGWIEKSAEMSLSFDSHDPDRLFATFSQGDMNTQHSAFYRLKEVYDPRLIDLLLKYLESGTDRQRGGAIETLASYRDERVVMRLLELFPAQTSGMRVAFVDALGQLADPRAAEPLVKLVEQPDKESDLKLSMALVRIGGKTCDDAVVKLLQHPDVGKDAAAFLVHDPLALEACVTAFQASDKAARLNFLENLGSATDRHWTALLTQLVLDNDLEIRAAAEFAAARIYAADTTAAYFAELVQSPDPGTRIHAADVLSMARDFSAFQPLAILMHDPDVNVRRAAFGALCQSGDMAEARKKRLYPNGVPRITNFALYSFCNPMLLAAGKRSVLIAAFDDTDPVVRTAAATVFAGIYDQRKPDLLRPLLKSEQPQLRALALKGLAIQAQTGEIAAGLNDPDATIREAATDLLVSMPPATPDRIALVQPLLKSADKATKLAAIRCLAQSFDTSGAAAVLPLLDDPDAETKKCALQALAGSFNEQAFRAAAKFLKSTDVELRDQAIKALLRNPNTLAQDPVLAVLSTGDEKARAAVRAEIQAVLAEHDKTGVRYGTDDKLKNALEQTAPAPTAQDF